MHKLVLCFHPTIKILFQRFFRRKALHQYDPQDLASELILESVVKAPGKQSKISQEDRNMKGHFQGTGKTESPIATREGLQVDVMKYLITESDPESKNLFVDCTNDNGNEIDKWDGNEDFDESDDGDDIL